jgi:hypothetical protein
MIMHDKKNFSHVRYDICTLRYKDFDLFDKMEPPRPVIDVKGDSKKHF